MKTVLAGVLLFLVRGPQAGPIGDPITAAPDASLSSTSSATHHAIAYGDSCDRYLSLFLSPGLEGDADLHGALVDPTSGAVGAALVLDASEFEVHSPSAAWCAATRRFLVAYTREDGDPNIYGLVLDEFGAKVGGVQPFQISSTSRPAVDIPWYLNNPGGEAQGSCFQPKVVSDGTRWLVVWLYRWTNNPVGIEARIVEGGATNETPGFSTGILSVHADSLYCGAPAVAFGAGGDFLVTWLGSRRPGGVLSYGILGRTLSPAGVLGAPPTVFDFYSTPQPANEVGNPVYYPTPSLTANAIDGEFVIAWDERPVAGATEGDLRVRRIAPNGVPLAPSTVIPTEPSTRLRLPSIAWDPVADQYLAAWYERPSLAATGGVRAVRLSGFDASPLAADVAVASSMKGNRGVFVAARSGHDSQAAIQWLNDLGDGTRPVTIQRYGLGPNLNIPAISDASQYRPDGVTLIPPGQATPQTALVVRARVRQQQLREVRLEVELRPSDVAFAGVPTASSAMGASGAMASILLQGLVRGASYHWQVRGVDARGVTSDWTSFQEDPAAIDVRVRLNELPTAGPVVQATADGRILEVGQGSSGDAVEFRIEATDSDGDDVMVEIELRAAGESFMNVATAAGSFRATGQTATVLISSLRQAAYRWKFRLIDSALDPGPWISFGDNPEEAADFELMAVGSRNLRECFLSAGSRRPASGIPGAAALAILLALRRRRAAIDQAARDEARLPA